MPGRRSKPRNEQGIKPSWLWHGECQREAGYKGCVRQDGVVVWSCPHLHTYRDYSPEPAEISALDCARLILHIKVEGKPDDLVGARREAETELAAAVAAQEPPFPPPYEPIGTALEFDLIERPGAWAGEPTRWSVLSPYNEVFIKAAKKRKAKWENGPYWNFPTREAAMEAGCLAFPDFEARIAGRAQAVADAKRWHELAGAYSNWKGRITKARQRVARLTALLAAEADAIKSLDDPSAASAIVFARLSGDVKDSNAIPWSKDWWG